MIPQRHHLVENAGDPEDEDGHGAFFTAELMRALCAWYNRQTKMAGINIRTSEPSDAKIQAVIAGKSILVNEFGKIITFKDPP